MSRLHLHGLWRHGTVRTSDSDVTTAVGCANDHLDSFAGSFRLKSGQTRTVKGRHDVAATVLASAVARLQGAGVDHHNELCRLRRGVCRHHVVEKSHDRRCPSLSLHVVTLGFVRRSLASHERSAGSRCAKCMLETIWLFLSNNCSFSDSDCVVLPSRPNTTIFTETRALAL